MRRYWVIHWQQEVQRDIECRKEKVVCKTMVTLTMDPNRKTEQ